MCRAGHWGHPASLSRSPCFIAVVALIAAIYGFSQNRKPFQPRRLGGQKQHQHGSLFLPLGNNSGLSPGDISAFALNKKKKILSYSAPSPTGYFGLLVSKYDGADVAEIRQNVKRYNAS